jgi:hypothetical protein
MTHTSYKAESRKNYGTDRPGGLSLLQVQLGAILRIADAVEDLNENRENGEAAELKQEKRRSASYRGHMGRFKNERDEMSTMLKVFRACIKTGVFPAPDSPCDKKVAELLGK